MPGNYGVRWVDEASRVIKVLQHVAEEFAQDVHSEMDWVAAEPAARSYEADWPLSKIVREHPFEWNKFVVTCLFQIHPGREEIHIAHLTVVPKFAGINPLI